jgi:hypothetical protein
MSVIEILSEFKNGLTSFFDELIDQFPLEGDLVIIRIFLNDQVPITDIIDIFNHKINANDNELRNMVKDRNQDFFLEHGVFDDLNKNKVNHFKKLWRSNLLDDEDRKVIWRWVDSFIFLGDKYLKVVQNLA